MVTHKGAKMKEKEEEKGKEEGKEKVVCQFMHLGAKLKNTMVRPPFLIHFCFRKILEVSAARNIKW